MLPLLYSLVGKFIVLMILAISFEISETVGYFPSAAAKGMYHHRYLKSPFLRNKKSQEEVQLLPEIGLARKHTGNSIQDASMELNEAYQNSDHKRSALLLDKLMYALQKAIDEKEENSGSSIVEKPEKGPSEEDSSSQMGIGLERRGKSHGKVYWRCYFNAVSCFK